MVINMNSILDVNAETWEKEVIHSNILVLVDFWHNRCTYCLKLNPLLEEVSKEYEKRVKFVKLNVMESVQNKRTAIEHGVMGTPTLIFFCDKRSVGTFVGFQPKERLKQIIDDMYDKYHKCIGSSTIL